VFERFTERARQVVVLAQEQARALNHDYIGTEHILLGLLCEEEGLACRVLESLGVTAELVRAQVVRVVGSGEAEGATGPIPFTPHAKKVLELALREALGLGHNYIGTEHVLLGLVHDDDGVAARILVDLDADPEKIRSEVIARAQSDAPARPQPLIHSGSTASIRIHGGPQPPLDSGWLDGLTPLLEPLGAEIRAELGRAPDVGDLLLAVACIPHTPAAAALSEMGIDVDELWGRIERARVRDQTAGQALAKRLSETVAAKDLALEEGRFADAAAMRDQERELREQARVDRGGRREALTDLRRRLGIVRPPG
jgi:hypothetical protein